MAAEWATLRVWKKTYKMAKVMAALRGLTLGQLVHFVLLDEFLRSGLDESMVE